MLLNPEECAQIESKIAAIEQRTAGEIVITVVRRSGAYGLPRALFCGTWTIALALAAHALWPHLVASWLLLAQAPLAVLLWQVADWGPVLRRLVPHRSLTEAVQARAMQVFTERGISHTRDQSGLLIVLSELERRVVILADRGIHAHVGTLGWQKYVDAIVSGLRQKRAASAVLGVLDAVGDILAQKFPPRPDDIDELPDTVQHLS